MDNGHPSFFCVSGLRKHFGTRVVLDGVSFEIGKGRTGALIGSSGSGKTTLLKCVVGLEKCDAGHVALEGMRFVSTRASWFQPNTIASRIGLVFQDYNLWGTMTAFENLTLPLVRVKGVSSAEARDRALTLARRFRLEHLLDRPTHRLSGGERQRFALLRAVLLEPQVLLLDEITAALDVEMRCAVMEMLWELSASGMTMLLVSHEISFVRHIADTVFFLRDGVLAEHGPTEELLSNPQTAELRRFLERIQIPARPLSANHQVLNASASPIGR